MDSVDEVDGPSNSILHSNCLFYFKQTFLVNDELRRAHGLWPSALYPCIGPEGASIFWDRCLDSEADAESGLSAPRHHLDIRLFRFCPHLPSCLHTPLAPQKAWGMALLQISFSTKWDSWYPRQASQLRTVGEAEGRNAEAVQCLFSHQSQHCSQRVNLHSRLAISKE